MANPNGSVTDGFNGRTKTGRFGPQNKYGHGNPNQLKSYEFRTWVLEAGNKETVQANVRKLGEMGAAGDVTAAKIYLEFLQGKPHQAVEISGPDGESLGISLAQIQAVLVSVAGADSALLYRLTEGLYQLVRPKGHADVDQSPGDRP